MKNKSVEIVSTALALGVVLSAVIGVGVHKRSRKDTSCWLARAECVQSVNDESEKNVFAGTEPTKQPSLFTNAKSAYVIEKESGISVFEKDGTKRLPIASMCKIMTLLLTFEGIDNGVISMNEEITVSQNAADMGGSQVFLEANAAYPVSELIKSIVVCSANDSCVALAEKIAGSADIFVDRMNTRAKELGCENTLFANCTGLPKEPQYSCAKDVAKMFSALLEHEEYFTYGKIWLDTFKHPQGRTTEITNTNRLVKFYDGCDGGKTGFTNEAGFCLAATAKRGDMRIISVVIGEKDSKTRFKEVSESFDYTFANYAMQKVVDVDGEQAECIPVLGGKMKCVAVKPVRNAYLFVKRGTVAEYQTQVFLNASVKAPIKSGEIVGEIRVYRDGVECDAIPLITADSVEKASYGDSLRDVANHWNCNGK
ncbi:MAG: D-alanyl-D-alanine carboxypeptidase [Clostridia bacterium]|nr:D-alanyl-D-alanine carboxypeptidase [Clostridia bacterium]